MRLPFASLSFRVVAVVTFLLACGPAGRAPAQGFAAPVLIPTGNQPDFVAMADVNGDGIPDLIFIDGGSNPQGSVTHVRLGDGTGAFRDEAVLATGGSRVAIGDLLGDGRIAIGWLLQQGGGGSNSALYIAEGDGKGNFTSGQYETAFPGSPQQSPFLHVAAGRTHDQGPLDLFGLTTAGNNAEAYSYQANLQATAGPLSLTTLAQGEGPIMFADLNNDGHGDMLLVGDTTHVAQVFLGGGNGMNGISALPVSQPTTILSVLLQDVNGDGKLDLIAEAASGSIKVYAGNGDGTFQTASLGGTMSVDDSAGDGGHLLAAVDVNGDGIVDLLTYTPVGVSVELGTAGGNYTLQGVYPVGTLAGVGGQFAVADFNGDGALDVAMDAPGGIEILYGKPSGSTGCATPAPGTLAACPEPSAFESGFTLTATGPGGAGGGDTGTVSFSIAGSQSYQTQTATLGTAPMVNGVATLMVTGKPLTGNPIIPGDYAVNGSFVATGHALAANLPGTHTINLAPSTVTLTPAPPSTTLGPTYYYGQGVNGYVHFNTFDPAYPATGTWTQLSNGVAVPGCVDLSVTAAGGSSCPYGYPQLLDAGNYVFTEAYNGGPANGDPINASSVSAPYAFAVIPDTTAVNSLISSLNPAPVGTPVTFTVTLTGNAAVPTGTVQFLDGTNMIGSGTLNASGQASFTTSTLAVGTHPMTAVYAATLDFNGVTSPVLSQVITALPAQPLGSAVTLSSSVNPSLLGQAVTFTAAASVPGPFPFLIQSGTIAFLDGASVIGTGAIDQFGRATFTTSTLALGSHPITASYPGGMDAGGQAIAASVSAVLTQVVVHGLQNAPPGFTLTVTPNPVVLKPGTTGVELVTVAALSGFSQAVTLGCTGTNSSNELGCDFVAETIPAGGGATTLDLTTTAPYACGGSPTKPYLKQGEAALVVPACGVPARRTRLSGWLAAEVGVPMMAGLAWMWPKRRRRWAQLLALVMLAGVVGLSGCGNCSNLGTRPGNYGVTVTATAGSVTHSVVLKIDVLDP